MTDKVKATRTPRNYDSILKGAQSLTLKERVDLVNAITAQNKQEAAKLAEAAKDAASMVG